MNICLCNLFNIFCVYSLIYPSNWQWRYGCPSTLTKGCWRHHSKRNEDSKDCTVSMYFELACAALHCTAQHCTALNCTALHCIELHSTALHCTALNCTALHCTALNRTALQWTELALHCTAFLLSSPSIKNILGESSFSDHSTKNVNHAWSYRMGKRWTRGWGKALVILKPVQSILEIRFYQNLWESFEPIFWYFPERLNYLNNRLFVQLTNRTKYSVWHFKLPIGYFKYQIRNVLPKGLSQLKYLEGVNQWAQLMKAMTFLETFGFCKRYLESWNIWLGTKFMFVLFLQIIFIYNFTLKFSRQIWQF